MIFFSVGKSIDYIFETDIVYTAVLFGQNEDVRVRVKTSSAVLILWFVYHVSIFVLNEVLANYWLGLCHFNF